MHECARLCEYIVYTSVADRVCAFVCVRVGVLACVSVYMSVIEYGCECMLCERAMYESVHTRTNTHTHTHTHKHTHTHR